jgi:hypothetical protein
MAGVRITQLHPYGGPGAAYGSFAGKALPSAHPVVRLTTLWGYGGPGEFRRAGQFGGKTPSAPVTGLYIPTFRRRRR